MPKRKTRWISEAAEQLMIDWLLEDDDDEKTAGDGEASPAARLREETSPDTTPPVGDTRPKPRIRNS